MSLNTNLTLQKTIQPTNNKEEDFFQLEGISSHPSKIQALSKENLSQKTEAPPASISKYKTRIIVFSPLQNPSVLPSTEHPKFPLKYRPFFESNVEACDDYNTEELVELGKFLLQEDPHLQKEYLPKVAHSLDLITAAQIEEFPDLLIVLYPNLKIENQANFLKLIPDVVSFFEKKSEKIYDLFKPYMLPFFEFNDIPKILEIYQKQLISKPDHQFYYTFVKLSFLIDMWDIVTQVLLNLIHDSNSRILCTLFDQLEREPLVVYLLTKEPQLRSIQSSIYQWLCQQKKRFSTCKKIFREEINVKGLNPDEMLKLRIYIDSFLASEENIVNLQQQIKNLPEEIKQYLLMQVRNKTAIELCQDLDNMPLPQLMTAVLCDIESRQKIQLAIAYGLTKGHLSSVVLKNFQEILEIVSKSNKDIADFFKKPFYYESYSFSGDTDMSITLGGVEFNVHRDILRSLPTLHEYIGEEKNVTIKKEHMEKVEMLVNAAYGRFKLEDLLNPENYNIFRRSLSPFSNV
jgi:hypothetical protein